jgi:hypothetical protein
VEFTYKVRSKSRLYQSVSDVKFWGNWGATVAQRKADEKIFENRKIPGPGFNRICIPDQDS